MLSNLLDFRWLQTSSFLFLYFSFHEDLNSQNTFLQSCDTAITWLSHHWMFVQKLSHRNIIMLHFENLAHLSFQQNKAQKYGCNFGKEKKNIKKKFKKLKNFVQRKITQFFNFWTSFLLFKTFFFEFFVIMENHRKNWRRKPTNSF